jgi:hypothetical protein
MKGQTKCVEKSSRRRVFDECIESEGECKIVTWIVVALSIAMETDVMCTCVKAS